MTLTEIQGNLFDAPRGWALVHCISADFALGAGIAKHAFMGLYEVAYGKPYDVYSFSPRFGSFNWHALQTACPGASCLHAHEGNMLRNDEIIVYRECQTTVKYLVELEA